MFFSNQKQTNWKFIAIVIIVASVAGSGVLGYLKYLEKEIITLNDFSKIEKPEREILVTKVLFTIPEEHGDIGRISNSIIFGPDNNRFTYVVGSTSPDFPEPVMGPNYVVSDGKIHEEYGWINPRSLVFSPNGKHLAYVAVSGNAVWPYKRDIPEGGIWNVVLDEEIIGQYDFASEFIFSPNGNDFAYVARKEGSSFIVLNGKRMTEYDMVRRPVFSSDGSQFAYIAEKNAKQFVVLNGEEKEKYSRVVDFQFSSDNTKYGYWGEEIGAHDEFFIVFNNQKTYSDKSPEFFQISPDGKEIVYRKIYSYWDEQGPTVVRNEKEYPGSFFCFSPDGSRFGRRVIKDGVNTIFVDDSEIGRYSEPTGCPVFSPDNKKFAYVGHEYKHDIRGRRLFINGIPQQKYDYIRVLQWSPNSQYLANIAIEGGKRYIVLAGKKEKEYSKYDYITNFRFDSGNKHVIYNAINGRDILMVVEEI